MFSRNDETGLRNFSARHFVALLLILIVSFAAHSLAQQNNRIITPKYAFSGGKLVGTVVDETGKRVSGAPVKMTSLSGVVIDTETDHDGTFKADLPEDKEGEDLSFELAGVATDIAIAVVTSLPDDVLELPPTYTEFDSEISIAGDWPEVGIETEPANGESSEYVNLGTGRALDASGTEALTTYYIPQDLQLGPAKTILTSPMGEEFEFPTHMYGIVSASLDHERLRSGQMAEFIYEFAFGEGEKRTIPATVSIEGPSQYELAGEPQPLVIGKDGTAVLKGKIRALKGSPEGIPFAINAFIGEVQRPGELPDTHTLCGPGCTTPARRQGDIWCVTLPACRARGCACNLFSRPDKDSDWTFVAGARSKWREDTTLEYRCICSK